MCGTTTSANTAVRTRGTLITCWSSKAGVPVSLEMARIAATEASSRSQSAALPCAFNSMPECVSCPSETNDQIVARIAFPLG